MAFVCLLPMLSCNDFGDINQDPTKSTDMDPNLILPDLQMMLTNDYQEWHRYMMYPGGWTHQWCGDWGTTEYGCLGIKNDSYMGEMWYQRYGRMAKGLVDIVERSKDNPNLKNINAIGRIMRTYVYAQLTDMYGDIPYSEAGYGYYSGILKPKYDAQQDIYTDFFNQLDIANQELDVNGDLITYDQYFNGDITKWKRYCNSLHLRLALRLIKVMPDLAKAEATKAIANGVMQSNDDICAIHYENFANPSEGPGRGNALSNRFMADPHNFRIARDLIAYMEKTQDPRITIYGGCYLEDADATDITQKIYEKVGNWTEMSRPTDRFDWENYDDDPNSPTQDVTIEVNGANVVVPARLTYLQPSKWLTAYDAPYINMSYAETEFLLAECAQRWNLGTGSAAEHFTKGLQAAVQQMTLYGAPAVSDTDLDKFIKANPYKETTGIEQINMQIWVEHLLNPFESFANWRRTGIPKIKFLNRDAARNQSNGQFPRRLLYPSDEQVKNPENYNAAIEKIQPYDWTTPVWWDKQ
ncbi:Starch-binding associating with outer membrane [Prevotella sp. KH2C16]|nr:Starch-binding associating with outer membrane [Prevotella sp. KH2C16]